MKKAILTGVLSVFTIGFLLAQTGVEELPKSAKEYIEQQFPTENITFVEKDKDLMLWNNEDMYEVHFSSGLEVVFNEAGEVTEIDAAKDQEIPLEALPSTIVSYVDTNYKETGIKSWEVDGKDQDVELTNGVDLEFDKNGKFLRVD